MTDIDYSKNDFIDINNQLFRRARNNIAQGTEPIKDMDFANKETAKSNLQIFGSELINNLNQINYTLEQVETYLFVPSKIVKGKVNQVIVSDGGDDGGSGNTKAIMLTPTTPLSAIKSPTTPLQQPPDVVDTPTDFSTVDDIDIGDDVNFRVDPDKNYTLEQYNIIIPRYQKAIKKELRKAQSIDGYDTTLLTELEDEVDILMEKRDILEGMPSLFARTNLDLDLDLEELDKEIARYRKEIKRINALNKPDDEYASDIRNDLMLLEMDRTRQRNKKILGDEQAGEDINALEQMSKYLEDQKRLSQQEKQIKLETDKLLDAIADGYYGSLKRDALKNIELQQRADVLRRKSEVLLKIVNRPKKEADFRVDVDLIYTLDQLNDLIPKYDKAIKKELSKDLARGVKNRSLYREELEDELDALIEQRDDILASTPVIRLPKPPPPPRPQGLEELIDLPLPPLPTPPTPQPIPNVFSRVDKVNKLSLSEVEQQIKATQSEIEKTRNQLENMKRLKQSDAIKKAVKQRNDYINDLGFDLEFLYNYDSLKGFRVGSGRYRGGAVIKGKVVDTSPIKAMISVKGFKVSDVKTELKNLGFPKKEVGQLRKDNILQYLEEKDKETLPEPVVQTPKEFESLEEAPKDEANANLDIANKLDKVLAKLTNMGQNTPVPSYLSKVSELITTLIQFIGRTTLLYITRIKKNLNYLDEEQVKLIYNSNELMKSKLDMLKSYGEMSGALIKQTLYKQLEKEMLGLYNQINDSIRNYNKLKDYTIFSKVGGGFNYGVDRMVGGYFIESDNPFIRHSTTKRFL
jgi:uncharacterized small protein (DUF1192 family)